MILTYRTLTNCSSRVCGFRTVGGETGRNLQRKENKNIKKKLRYVYETVKTAYFFHFLNKNVFTCKISKGNNGGLEFGFRIGGTNKNAM